MTTHSSILAWKIPWAEEPGGLQSLGLQRVRHDSTVTCGGDGLGGKSGPTLVTPWTVAHQSPLSMGFPRQDY